MNLRRSAATFISSALCVLACSGDPGSDPRDPSPDTPEAAAEGERLMRQMSDTLAMASTFRFTTEESLEPIGEAGGRVLRFSRAVTVKRPDAMVFEVDGLGDTTADVSAAYEGATLSLRNNRRGVWAQTDVPGTLDEMLDDVARRFSLPVPIADVVYSTPYEAFIGPATRGGFVRRETIDGVECAHLIYADDFVEVRVWIPSTDQPLPRRLELVYKLVPGAPTARIDFTSWDLTPQIAEGAFTFQPGEAAKQISFEQFASSLLSGDPGSEAAASGVEHPATQRVAEEQQ